MKPRAQWYLSVLGGILLLAGGCSGSGSAGISLSFASQQQALPGQVGLPADLASLQVSVRDGDLHGILLGQSQCLDVSSQEQRQSLTVDITAGTGLTIVVEGYQQAGCPAGKAPTWMGATTGVDIVAGQHTEVAVFVTRRGGTLNFTRGELTPALAFASATVLADGRVLIAGGFEQISDVAGGVELTASSRAFLYDPATASFLPTGSLSSARGGHDAVLLVDGRVLLVGGCQQLDILYDGSGYFRLTPSLLPATADIYDPQSGAFSPVGPDPLLARFQPAVVASAGNQVILAGGRTELARSDEVIVGVADGNGFDWSRLSEGLSEKRRGARAVLLDDDIVVVGGGEAGGEGAEAATVDSWRFMPLEQLLQDDLAVTGHALITLPGHRAIWSGGLPETPGMPARDYLLQLQGGNPPQLSASVVKMTHGRAYHLAASLGDGRILLAGGLGEDFQPTGDLEIFNDQEQSLPVEGQQLACGWLGAVSANLPDGSVLLAGGLSWQQGRLLLERNSQVFSP